MPGALAGRVLGKRYVGGAALEHGQHRQRQAMVARQAQHDALLRPGAMGLQGGGQVAGGLVQFGVVQLPPGVLHGQRLGVAGRVGGERLQQALPRRHRHARQTRSVAPCPGLVQLAQCALGVGQQGLEQRQVVLGHGLHGRFAEQVGAVLQAQGDAMLAVAHVQVQVAQGAVGPVVDWLGDQLRQLETLQGIAGEVVEHHLEQRVVADLTHHAQLLDQVVEWQVLVRLHRHRQGLQIAHQLQQAALARQVLAVDQGVDEAAHQRL